MAAVKLYYGGVEARQDEGKNRFAPVGYISSFSAGKTLSAYPSYSVKCAEVTSPDKRVVLQADYELYPGVNFFWVSLQMKPGTSLSAKVGAELASVSLDGKKALCHRVSPDGIVHRMGIGVRHAGNDGAAAFRIPGLVQAESWQQADRGQTICDYIERQPYVEGATAAAMGVLGEYWTQGLIGNDGKRITVLIKLFAASPETVHALRRQLAIITAFDARHQLVAPRTASRAWSQNPPRQTAGRQVSAPQASLGLDLVACAS